MKMCKLQKDICGGKIVISGGIYKIDKTILVPYDCIIKDCNIITNRLRGPLFFIMGEGINFAIMGCCIESPTASLCSLVGGNITSLTIANNHIKGE